MKQMILLIRLKKFITLQRFYTLMARLIRIRRFIELVQRISGRYAGRHQRLLIQNGEKPVSIFVWMVISSRRQEDIMQQWVVHCLYIRLQQVVIHGIELQELLPIQIEMEWLLFQVTCQVVTVSIQHREMKPTIRQIQRIILMQMVTLSEEVKYRRQQTMMHLIHIGIEIIGHMEHLQVLVLQQQKEVHLMKIRSQE